MSIAPYLREIGRGKEGARHLDRARARDLMERLLGGQVSDAELGAFALAMRIKGESPQELAGFLDAAVPLTLPIATSQPVVVLPSYNGARKLPNLTAMLAMLLAREGLPVLVHGPIDDPGRVTTAAVFDALGLPPCLDAASVRARWAAGTPAFMPIDQLHPTLARLLALRRVLGLRNSGHTMAKLLPAVALAHSLRVVNHTHPEYATSLAQYLCESAANAALMRGTEGEPVADARRMPRIEVFVGGIRSEALSVPQQEGPLQSLPDLPAGIDAAATARHAEGVLGGRAPAPGPVLRQVQCLVEMHRALAQGPVGATPSPHTPLSSTASS